MRVLKRLACVVAGSALVGGMSLSSAMAISTSYNGSTASNGVNVQQAWDWVKSADTANDGQFTSTNWKMTGGTEGGPAVNKNGPNTTVTLGTTVHPTRTTQIKACVSRTALPMACGSWVSTGL